jgi:hypothetical protein
MSPKEPLNYNFGKYNFGKLISSPHSWLVSIMEVSELVCRKHTNKDKVTRLPVDKIVNEILASSLVKSLSCNIIANCNVEITKECYMLLLDVSRLPNIL